VVRVGFAVDPRHSAGLDVVVVNEGDGSLVHVHVLGRVQVGPASELEANFQLTVPEEAELQLRTQTGLVYVEQVMAT